jgi:hypothetical protein
VINFAKVICKQPFKVDKSKLIEICFDLGKNLAKEERGSEVFLRTKVIKVIDAENGSRTGFSGNSTSP